MIKSKKQKARDSKHRRGNWPPKKPGSKPRTGRLWKNLRTESHAKNTVVYKREERDPVWKGTYYGYLKSKQWRRVKYGYFLWLKRNGGLRCKRCNGQMTKKNRAQFNVHHRTYERLGCERHEDLELLCVTCHDKEHAKGGEDETE